MIFLKTRVDTKEGVAELASILCLMSFSYCSVAAYFAVSSLPIRQGLGKSSLGEAPREHCCRLRLVVALKVLQQPLGNGNSVLQLTDAGVCCSFEHYVCVHERHIKEVEENPLPPFYQAMGKPVVEDQLIT